MCAYCQMADFQFRHNAPWQPYHNPYDQRMPTPIRDQLPWGLERLKEYHDILVRVKALEDEVGCAADPLKPDYIALFKERIASLEKKVNGVPTTDSPIS